MSGTGSLAKCGDDHLSRGLNDEELFRLRQTFKGSIIDSPNGLALDMLESFMKGVAAYSPKLARAFIQSFAEGRQS